MWRKTLSSKLSPDGYSSIYDDERINLDNKYKLKTPLFEEILMSIQISQYLVLLSIRITKKNS
jgi:hypothetical protein